MVLPKILILLTLLGGIGVYSKDWSTASAGKVGISSSPTTNVQQAFKYLFTWLILINILLIVILCIYLYRKMKTIWDLQTGTSGVTDKFQTDQTMRSRMAGLNNPDFDGQVMRDLNVDERRNDNVVSSRNSGSTTTPVVATPGSTAPVVATPGSTATTTSHVHAAGGADSDSDSGSLNRGSHQELTRTPMERRRGLSNSAGGGPP